MSYHKNANRIFLLIASLVTLFVVVSIYYISIITPIIVSLIQFHFFSAPTCECSTLLSFSQHPFLNSFLLTSYSILCMWLLWVFVRFFRVFIRTYHVFHRLRHIALSKEHIPKILRSVTKELHIEKRVLYVASDEILLACIGFLHPMIVVSDQVLKILDAQELEITLLHEKQHLHNHDSFKFGFMNIFYHVLIFVPGWKYLITQFSIFTEFAADSYVLSHMISPKRLAQSIVKVMSHQYQISLASPYSFIGFVAEYELRLTYLLKSHVISLCKKKVLGTLLLLFFFFSSILFMSQGYSVLVQDDNITLNGQQCALLQPQFRFFSAKQFMTQRVDMSFELQNLCKN